MPAPPPPAGGTATLQWTAAADPRVVGYRVYWGTSSGSYQQSAQAGNVTSYFISNLPAGRTYYFAATAVDGNGAESAYSAEASKTIP